MDFKTQERVGETGRWPCSPPCEHGGHIHHQEVNSGSWHLGQSCAHNPSMVGEDGQISGACQADSPAKTASSVHGVMLPHAHKLERLVRWPIRNRPHLMAFPRDLYVQRREPTPVTPL